MLPIKAYHDHDHDHAVVDIKLLRGRDFAYCLSRKLSNLSNKMTHQPKRSRSEIDVIRLKLATIRILFTNLRISRANDAARIETGELSAEHPTLEQEILLTEMIHYDMCAQIIEAMEKTML